jgi:type VI secretion system protein ImpH
VLGSTVWDVQHKFRITIGPLPLQQYLRFLPGGADLARLKAMVRHWVGLEYQWDLRLILQRQEVPRLQLRRSPQDQPSSAGAPGLGRTTWLGHFAQRRAQPGSASAMPQDAADLCIDVERARFNRRAPASAVSIQ